MYSTCFSVVSAGYCGLNFLAGRDTRLRCGVGWVEEGVGGVRELLLTDSHRGRGGAMPVPLRIEGLEGVRVEGKEDREVWRLRIVFALPIVPLVEGRYERTEVIFGQLAGRRVYQRTQQRDSLGHYFES